MSMSYLNKINDDECWKLWHWFVFCSTQVNGSIINRYNRGIINTMIVAVKKGWWMSTRHWCFGTMFWHFNVRRWYVRFLCLCSV